ncbi:MAG: hypothetical protein LBJ09_03380 [Clostridiales bacterium]|jgi:hypothetical protein|nr:hypothetical protein [Clostridiales bacterium]
MKIETIIKKFPNLNIRYANENEKEEFRQKVLAIEKPDYVSLKEQILENKNIGLTVSEKSEEYLKKKFPLVGTSRARFALDKLLYKEHIVILEGVLMCVFVVGDHIISYTPDQVAYLLSHYENFYLMDDVNAIFKNKKLFFPEEDSNSSYKLSKEQREKISKFSKFITEIKKLLPRPENNFNFFKSVVLFSLETCFKQFEKENKSIPYAYFKIYSMIFKANGVEDIKGSYNKSVYYSLVSDIYSTYKSKNISEKVNSIYQKMSPLTLENKGILNEILIIFYCKFILPIETWLHGTITHENFDQKLRKKCSEEEYEQGKKVVENLNQAREKATELVEEHGVHPSSFKNYVLRNPEIYPSKIKKEEPPAL